MLAPLRRRSVLVQEIEAPHRAANTTARLRTGTRARGVDLRGPEKPVVDPSVFKAPELLSLPKTVQNAVRGLLAVAPERAPEIMALIGLESFVELSALSQRALLTPPRPERIDHALALLKRLNWSLMVGEKEGFFRLPLITQNAIMAQVDGLLVKPTARYLLAATRTDWLKALDVEDQLRAVKVIAYAASQLVGAKDGPGVSQKAVIERTLEAVTKPGAFDIVFEDLPAERGEAIGGIRRLPGTVVLNRHLLSADDVPIGDGNLKEVHVGLTTLVHEVDHLLRAVPEGPTYAAFQDEYRAWFIGLVAYRGSTPSMIEGLRRCQELFGSSVYADIGEALDAGNQESAKILGFMRNFGALKTRSQIMALELDNYVAMAPSPDPTPAYRD